MGKGRKLDPRLDTPNAGSSCRFSAAGLLARVASRSAVSPSISFFTKVEGREVFVLRVIHGAGGGRFSRHPSVRVVPVSVGTFTGHGTTVVDAIDPMQALKME
jgi:hypothetical protein